MAPRLRGGEEVDPGRLRIELFGEALGRKIRETDPKAIAFRFGCEGENDDAFVIRFFLATFHSPCSNNVQVHTGTRDVFAKLIDNEHVQVVEGNAREMLLR